MLKRYLVAVVLGITALATFANPIRITGIGITLDQAKNDAFRRAIELQIGTVIVSNFELSKNHVVRNEILAYSSGYVENFRILSTSQIGSHVYAELDVWVSTSKIANRILSSGVANKNVNGSLVNEQINTFLGTKQRGGELIKTTFLKFPQTTFDVNVKKYDFMHDAQRNVFVNLQYVINYNENWIAAFRETLTHIADENKGHRPDSVVMFHDYPNSFFENRMWNYWVFNEMVTLELLRKYFESQQPVLKVQLMSGNQAVQTDCFAFNKSLFYNHETLRGGVPAIKIFPRAQLRDSVQFYIRNFAALNTVTEIKLDIIQLMDCK